MRQYTKAYKGTMFDSNADYFKISNYVTVNTADAYAYIEGMVASIYAKAPAVSVGPDAKGDGDPEVAEAVINRFLYDRIEEFERSLRRGFVMLLFIRSLSSRWDSRKQTAFLMPLRYDPFILGMWLLTWMLTLGSALVLLGIATTFLTPKPERSTQASSSTLL
jgi:hypothetical protein